MWSRYEDESLFSESGGSGRESPGAARDDGRSALLRHRTTLEHHHRVRAAARGLGRGALRKIQPNPGTGELKDLEID